MYLKNYSIQLAKDILIRLPKKIVFFFQVLAQMNKFRNHHDKRFSIKFSDIYPCLTDKLKTTPFDQHYIYHPAWAARILAATRPDAHIDISSILSFASIVSAFVPTTFYDYRPADLKLSNWDSKFADLNNLPFANNSVPSLSCMHTIEHIGLGRYGDVIDPEGDLKAIRELIRVLKPGGTLLFATPVGQPRIEFNAHRIYSFEQIRNYFSSLHIQQFALIPDAGGLIVDADPELVRDQRYACGCFWFKKPA